MLIFRFPTHVLQRGRERLSIVPLRLEGSLPVYFCRYTSHYVAWSRTYDPRPFRQRLEPLGHEIALKSTRANGRHNLTPVHLQ